MYMSTLTNEYPFHWILNNLYRKVILTPPHDTGHIKTVLCKFHPIIIPCYGFFSCQVYKAEKLQFVAGKHFL